MNNEPEISASEINRYIYCNRQWYLERKFRKPKARKKPEVKKPQAKHQNKKKARETPIARGLKFHSNYMRTLQIKRTAAKVLLFLFFAAAVGLFIYLRFIK